MIAQGMLYLSLLEAAEGRGTPWWAWILVFLALAGFLVLLVWWWMRGAKEAEEVEEPAARATTGLIHPHAEASRGETPVTPSITEAEGGAAPAGERLAEAPPLYLAEPVPEAEAIAEAVPPAEMPVVPGRPDDLQIIEGIGPKISAVLRAAGITTFAQLAATDRAAIVRILEEANPNLLRLADPTTWPEQARLAAAGRWEELEALASQLKGGRRAG